MGYIAENVSPKGLDRKDAGAKLQFAFTDSSYWCVILRMCLALLRQWVVARSDPVPPHPWLVEMGIAYQRRSAKRRQGDVVTMRRRDRDNHC